MNEKQPKEIFPLRSLYFYLTEGCNLRCRHCWIQPKYQSDERSYPSLDFDVFEDIIQQAKPLGLLRIKLSGGEPLLHPRILDILDLIRRENLRLIVETNGLLCTEEICRAMAKCKNPFVSVSLDGVDAATHEWMRGVDGCFELALEGIRNLVKAGFKPQIIMSLVRRNEDQIEQVVRLAESLGAGSLKFNIVQPTARGEQMYESQEALPLERLVELGEWVERNLSASTDVELYYSHPIAFRPLGRMFGKRGNGCNLCGIFSILGVLADGSYAMCGIGETVPELIYGNATEDRLEDVWRDTPTLVELRKGLPERLNGVCARCMLRGICLGHCVAQNYYNYKSLWAPYWYCEEAFEKGIFPRNRLSTTLEGGAASGPF